MKWLLLISILFFSFQASPKEESEATNKRVIYRKQQKVNFDGSDVDGTVRSPDGAYLVQKRGVQFLPLYKIEDKFDQDVDASAEYLK